MINLSSPLNSYEAIKDFEADYLSLTPNYLDTPSFDLTDFFIDPTNQDSFSTFLAKSSKQQNFVESNSTSCAEDGFQSSIHKDFEESYVSHTKEATEASDFRTLFEKMISADIFPQNQNQQSVDLKGAHLISDQIITEDQNFRPVEISTFPPNQSDPKILLPLDEIEMPLPQKPADFSHIFPSQDSQVDESHKTHKKRRAKNQDLTPSSNRQSKFKNTYSLAEGQARRLIRDWLTLDRYKAKHFKDQENKSIEVRMQENNQIQADIKMFDSIEQECNDISQKIKLIGNSKSYFHPEMQGLLSQHNSLLAQKKKLQKQLLQRLSYNRLGLVSSLSVLVNNSPSAFVNKSELLLYVKRTPETRAVTCMKSLLKENIKCGLIVLSVALELLSPTLSEVELTKSDYAFLFWLTKTTMENPTKELFKNEATRKRIRGVLANIYVELREAAENELSNIEIQQFDSVFDSCGSRAPANLSLSEGEFVDSTGDKTDDYKSVSFNNSDEGICKKIKLV